MRLCCSIHKLTHFFYTDFPHSFAEPRKSHSFRVNTLIITWSICDIYHTHMPIKLCWSHDLTINARSPYRTIAPRIIHILVFPHDWTRAMCVCVWCITSIKSQVFGCARSIAAPDQHPFEMCMWTIEMRAIVDPQCANATQLTLINRFIIEPN